MLKVLVIEDNVEIRENVCEILELEGFAVVGAVDGPHGLECIASDKPDLVLCDIAMPGMNGHEVLLRLQQLGDAPLPCFIFLTAKAEKRDRQLGRDLGADGYVNKPFETAELIGEINRCLGR